MTDETIIHVFWDRVKTMPDKPAMMYKTASSPYKTLSWKEEGQLISELSAGLLSFGIKSGEKAAIVSSSRAHWTWSDLASLSIGAVTVPVYPSLNSNETFYVLNHCEATVAFLENPRQLKKLASLPSLPENLKFVVLFEGEWQEEFPLPVYAFEQLRLAGVEHLKAHPKCVQDELAKIKSDQLATIVYTSGTTGVPKGAMIKHSNIYYVCQTLSVNVGFTQDDLGLSFLPLSHIFERVGGQFLLIYEGICLAYAESMDSVAENINEIRPTIMNAVPRFYEKAYNKIQSQIRTLPTPQQYFARWALSLGRRAVKASEDKKNGNGDGQDLARQIYRTELRIADRFVFRKIRQRFGGRLRFLVSGAAPLSPEVHLFFSSIGMPILEGYGLTETTAPVACNRPNLVKRGTVGKPLPGQEVKIAADGEIMVKGPNIFSGYYKNDEATEAAFSDGWFLTGDIGEIDAEGYLSIKDRKKDIIITAGGKHVAPQVLENMLAGQGLISRVLVYGDRRKYITALITLNPDELKSFASKASLPFESLEKLSHDPKVVDAVQTTVNDANAKLASFEQIKSFKILESDFSIDANELTPTLKLRRKFVSEKYHDVLDSLYEREDLEVEKTR